MKTEHIEYEADGVRMVGTLTVDNRHAERRPGVLVIHEAGGLSDHARGVAERLAALNYVAFAMDYFGDGKPMADPSKVMGQLQAWWADPTGIRARGLAALEVLKAQPETDVTKLAAIGYCFGGTTALELGRAGADLKAVVGFHSGLQTARPQDAANIKGKVLTAIGTADPIIPPEQRAAFEAEMTAAGVDWRMTLYGGVGHSFTNPAVDALNRPGLKYDERADHRSWRAMIDLFDETLI